MKPSTRKMVLAGAAVALVAALLTTVLNKRWWGRRITAKWDVHTGTEPGDPWTVYGPDWLKWSVPQLFTAWKDGKPGWYPKGQTPELPTGSEFDVK